MRKAHLMTAHAVVVFVLATLAMAASAAAWAQASMPGMGQERSPMASPAPMGDMEGQRMAGCDRMCMGMMGGHMGGWGTAGGVALGILILTALGLLVALEVIWLKYWLVRLRRNRPQPEATSEGQR